MMTRWQMLAATAWFAASVSPNAFAADDTAQAEVPAPEPYTGAKIRRWSPIVSDMDRAIELYRDILGLELARVYEDAPESYVFEIYGIEPGTTTRDVLP